MVEFGTYSSFRGWVRVRVLGYGSGVRGRKVKSRDCTDCALASDLVRALFNGGEELLANSAIMSFNSPVIKKMTVEDGRTTVDVHDFSKEAVQCFLKASYSGSLEALPPELFRDFNKIAHVFEVTWVTAKCFEWFKSFLETVEEKDFPTQLYVFDEAMFMSAELKKRNFLDCVMAKFRSHTLLIEHFVTNYLTDISYCAEKNLDAILELTNKNEDILVKVLLNNLKIDKSSLHPNSRRILERLDFSNYPSAHDSLYSELLEMLEMVENPSKEDYKLIMKILRQEDKTSNSNESGNKSGTLNLVGFPNLFLEFKHLKDVNSLDEIATFLLESPQVTNSYIFYDAMYAWLSDKSRCELDWPHLYQILLVLSRYSKGTRGEEIGHPHLKNTCLSNPCLT